MAIQLGAMIERIVRIPPKLLRYTYRPRGDWLALPVVASVAGITLLHYLTGAHFLPYHSIYRSLYYLPIAVAAVRWGWRGGLLVSLAISALYLPHVLLLGQQMPDGLPDNLLEILAFSFVAALTGWLADAQRRERRETAALRGYLDTILRSLPVGVGTTSGSGTIVARNPAATRIVDEFGASLTIPPAPGYSELRGEGRTVAVWRAPLKHATNGSAEDVLVFEELTEQRRLEERVRQAERLAALGKLAGGLAHEIRNPLAILRATTQLLAAKLAGDAGLRHYTAVLTGEADRIDSLIGALLSYASPHPPAIGRVDVRLLLHELATACRPYAGQHGVRIETGMSGELPQVAVDREQLRQALLNLILNAIQASPQGAAVMLSCEQQTTRLCVVIRDQGPGIPPELRNRVFDPFFTTREAGTGLGLAVVARIVADHGGTIDLEAPPDGGTVARLCLPVLPSGGVPPVCECYPRLEA